MFDTNKTYIRFSAGSDPISWLVQARTACRWSHVDFLIPETGQLLGALPGGGMQFRDKIARETRFAICEVPVAEGWRYAMEQLNSPYDWLGVFCLGLPFPSRNWQDDKYWWCSEIVAASLLHAGCPIVNPEVFGVTPRDLWYSSQSHLITGSPIAG